MSRANTFEAEYPFYKKSEMTRKQIIGEIQRTAKANGGPVLGWRRFEEVTGIRYHDWYGRFWTGWGDAVREAGFEPNRMSKAYDDEFLLERLVALTRQLKHVPTAGDLLLARRTDSSFPSEKVFRRLGSKYHRAVRLIEFCEARPGNEDVSALWREVPAHKDQPTDEDAEPDCPVVGYVYLLKHGRRREYKIGRTSNPLRRQGELGIQLPEEVQPLHHIKTDDPAGVERYWHTRFARKRKKGEWFALTKKDVSAFKRWKRIC